MVEVSRREFLAGGSTGLLARAATNRRPEPGRLLIDTHVEVWTLDAKYPFRHPEALI